MTVRNSRTRSTGARASSRGALCVLLAIVLLVGAPASAGFDEGPDTAPGGERLVAMGDSYASGPGIAPLRPGVCGRSRVNYATLLADTLGTTQFTEASCSGATTVDLRRAQTYGGGNPAQISAVGRDTTLVLLGTVGANDLGLISLLQRCLGDPDPCDDGSTRIKVAVRAQAAGQRIGEAVEAIRSRAPRAAVLVVGYGTYLPGRACASMPGMSDSEMVFVQEAVDDLSNRLREAALGAGGHFADLRHVPGSLEHTVCAAPEAQWLRGPSGPGIGLHPTEAGHRAVAAHLDGVVRQVWAGLPGRPYRAGVPWATQVAGALDRVRLKRRCVGKNRRTRAVVKLRRASEQVGAVTFTVGRRVVGTDRSRPFSVRLRASRWRRVPGRIGARVSATAGPLTRNRTLTVGRPACLRR